MSDPTQAVVTTAFCSAAGIFAVTAAVRRLAFGRPQVPVWQEPISETDDSRFAAPELASNPPPLPIGKVRSSFYHPVDIAGLALIYSIFFGLVVASVKAAAQVKLSPVEIASSIGFQLVIAGVVVAMVAPRVRLSEWLGLRWKGWHWVVIIAPVTVGVMWAVFATLYFTGYMKWIESFGVEMQQDTVKLLQNSDNTQVLVLMSIAAVLVAPMCEEIVFRGYLYPAAKRFAGPWVAGLCSALVFAAAHGSVAALLPLFIFGCVLVALYECTGSIWAPMAVHCCFNSATVAIQLGARFLHLNLDTGS